MAAITKRLLHLRPNFHSYARPQPYPLHFSSSSDPDTPQPDPNSEAETRSSFSSSFNDVKSNLQQPPPPPQNRRQSPRTPPQTTPPPSRAGSTEEIRRHLSEFRIRSAAPPPPSSAGQYVSLQELYERNVNSKGEGSAAAPNSGGKRSFDVVRESLRQLSPNKNDSDGKLSDRWSLSRFTENLKLKADQNSTSFNAGGESLVSSFLRNEGRGKGDSHIGFRRTEFGIYDHQDLGKRLRMLRPEKRKGKWFSLQELSERLVKLREAEDKEMGGKLGGLSVVKELRDGIAKVKELADEKAQKRPMQNLGFLGTIGGTQSYELFPPKDNLVEKYFHPDNMSSAEKLKLELKKVRDEFKMSESDCGSARVQVAQLTTKIKHLSTVLQKKDKHSRRGLQAMVQRRKKLLKYLRRTDWDSYCLVLSKLGLRDHADFKA